MTDFSNIWLITLVLAWSLTLWRYLKRNKKVGAGGVMIISFLIYSLLSLELYNDPFWGEPFKPLNLFPFIFLYLMIMLSISPIIRWDRMQLVEIKNANDKNIIYILWFFVICTFLRIPSEAPNLIDGMMTMIVSSTAGHEQYLETMENSQMTLGDGHIKNIFAIFSNLLFDFATLFLFYLLTKKEKRKTLLLLTAIGLLVSSILPIAKSQRGPVMEHILVIIITYFAFKKYIDEGLNRVIKMILGVLLSIITIPIAFITISRFEDRGVLTSLCNYFGQENLYFNNYAFDNNGLRYGDRIFPLFKKMLGFSDVPSSFWERRLKYPRLYINDEVFIGYVGDFLLDFGPIITVLIFMAYTSYVNSRLNRVRQGTIYLYNLLPLMLLMHICVYGALNLFPLADGGNLTIIVYVLMFYFLKYIK